MAKPTVKELQAENDLLRAEITGLRNMTIELNELHEKKEATAYTNGFAYGLSEGFEEAEASYRSQSFINRLLNKAL